MQVSVHICRISLTPNSLSMLLPKCVLVYLPFILGQLSVFSLISRSLVALLD